MEIRYSRAFIRDLRRVRDASIRRRVDRALDDLEAASTIAEVAGAGRIASEPRRYRIRIGDYRLGFALDGDAVTLMRFMHRRQIYRYFP